MSVGESLLSSPDTTLLGYPPLSSPKHKTASVCIHERTRPRTHQEPPVVALRLYSTANHTC